STSRPCSWDVARRCCRAASSCCRRRSAGTATSSPPAIRSSAAEPDVREDRVQRARDAFEVVRLDEEARVLDLARSAPEEATKLGLRRTALPLRLLLEGAKRREASTAFENLLDARRAERANQLALEVRLADVEAEGLHRLARELGSEPGPLERAAKTGLLSG